MSQNIKKQIEELKRQLKIVGEGTSEQEKINFNFKNKLCLTLVH